MLVNEEAIKEIARQSSVLDATASSHWDGKEAKGQKYGLAEDPLNFSKALSNFSVIGPIGAISLKKSFPYNLAHWLLQIPFRRMGVKLKEFGKFDRIAASIARRQGRAYDGDLMRHTLTMALFNTHLDMEKDLRLVAVIGDGFANMSSLLLEGAPNSRIILVNLTKTLLLDLAFLRQTLPSETIALVQSAEDMSQVLTDQSTRIIALQADNADLLAVAPVTLGINILSMIEMEPQVTAAYFDILRRCPSERTAFYCANHFEKFWADGTIIRFYEYPWDDEDTYLVDEPCPWDQYGYRARPPFYYARPSQSLHRLLYLKKHDAKTGA